MDRKFCKKAWISKIKPASINHTICGVIIKVFEDTGLSSVETINTRRYFRK